MPTKIISTLLALVALTSAAHAGSVKGQDLYGWTVFPCNGAATVKTWTAPTNTQVQKIEVQFGLDFNQASDFVIYVVRQSDNSIVANASHDHYYQHENQQYILDFAPNYYYVAAGDSLVLETLCSPISGPHNGAVGVTIWTIQ